MNTKNHFAYNDDLIGNCDSICEIRNLVVKTAKAEETTLITGETGTGKEIVAKLIYKNSQRARKPFIVVNCAAVPEGLAESELFGHEKGTFTNAFDEKDGKFLMADGGIIFLDEICSLSLNIQGKILRVLQEKEIQKIGCSKTQKINVFIIAATNHNLRNEVRKGKFRADLYYRLNVMTINLPPLRERRDDLELLTKHFLIKHKRQNNGNKKIHDETMSLFKKYSWPGNIRELENLIKRIIWINDHELITKDALPNDILKEIENDISKKCIKRCLKNALNKHEKEIIENTLKDMEYDIQKTASTLNLNKRELIIRLRKHEISMEKMS